MNPVAIRLLGQQLVSPQFSRPEEVVSHMGAIQAQEYRLMRWAVAMRTKNPSCEAFRNAYDSGRIIRAHLCRGTWQLIAAEDYAWMMDIFAPRAATTIRGWMHANGIDIPADEIRKIRDILVETTAKLRSATSEDYATALSERGITMDPHRLSYHIRFGELDGVLCSGNLLPMKATYSLVCEKIGGRDTLSREEAIALITKKYLLSRSPATLEDFVWWSGLGITECKKGIDSLGSIIRRERIDGREFLLHDGCRTRGKVNGTTLLIAPYDEYLIAYKSRDLVLPPEHEAKAHNRSGNFYPIVAQDGIICGNWFPFGKGPQFEAFESRYESTDISKQWEQYKNY